MNINLSNTQNASSLLNVLNSYNNEETAESKLLDDGKYITNHIYHPKGVREREIEIQNGSVVTEKFKFSQFSFFDVNYVVKKL